MKHSNISIFVSHIGCPNKCAFCNQYLITNSASTPTKEDVEAAVMTAVKSKNYDPNNTEIAFFGGSFTAIDRDYMLLLLKAAHRFVKQRAVSGIRISTRPDAIDPDVLEILKNHGVTAIELGAQSMSDEVLIANNRGHLSSDVEKASKLIKEYGFELGLQMMTGMYKSDQEADFYTAKKLAELNPDTVRIYPTITLKETKLEELFESGEYKPMSLESTVTLCKELLKFFESKSIKVIRLGLHSLDDETYVAGPWHPAFRELCESEMMLDEIKSQLKEKGKYQIFVNPSDLSRAIGQKRKNIKTLEQLGFECEIIMDEALSKSQLRILRV